MAITGVPRMMIRLVAYIAQTNKRQAEPGQARSAHPVHRDDEIQAGQDRRETGDEDAERPP